jgi:hypothetical protein
MFIDSLISNRKNFFWTIFHILLGFVCSITPFALIGWFYFILLSNIKTTFFYLKHRNAIYLFNLFSYLISFEVLDRMAKTSPFIPYELGKYMLIFMGLIGLYVFGVRSQRGIIMVIFLTPALFYDFSNQRVLSDIVNYYLGPLAVGLGIAFSDKLKITQNDLDQLLKLIYWATVASLVFTFVKTPNFDDIEFSLKAQSETTGGHSSNQVSTLLGLGMFLSYYSILNRKNYSGNRILEIVLLIGFTFQGLLSFSRGGMVVGGLGILLHSILSYKSILNRGKAMSNTFVVVILLIGSYSIVNRITNGNLTLRYQGETQGTLQGVKEKTSDQFVTGRLGIFEKDIDLFYNYPITGVGIGSSKYLRDIENTDIAAHVEMSRLLAEHGIFGVIVNCLLFGMFFIVYKNNNTQSNSILLILVLIALATTFHAAMRTFITPLFLIISNLKLRES